MKNKIHVLFWVASFVAAVWLNATIAIAKKTNQDFQSWGNVTALFSLERQNPDSRDMKVWLEGQSRFGSDSSRFSQGILRTGLGYYFHDNLSLWLGYAWIPNNLPADRNDFEEHRIWQQLLWTKKLGKGKFMSRTRLEQRYDERGDDVGWRFRQFFKYQHPFDFNSNLSWVIWDEIFVGLNRPDWKPFDGFDQNRIFLGVGYQVSQNVRSEVGYINQYIRNPGATDTENHILSVNLFLSY